MASDSDQDTQGTPVGEGISSTGDSRAGRQMPDAKRPWPGGRALIDTAGPVPGSPVDEVRLTVGVIGGTHGVRGELKLKLLTDHPEHLTTVKQVFLGESDEPTRLLGVRFHGEGALIRLDGVTSPEAGKRFGGLKVRIAGADARPLEEGEYFLFQLIGLSAVTSDGAALGTVTDMIETGAHDVLVITPKAGADILVPNHPRFVLDIDPRHNRIVIDPPVYET